MEQIFNVNWALTAGALLVLAGILSSRIASRLGVPLLLIFLLLGMLVGEDGPGGLIFNDYKLSYLIGSAALALILFDGGLRTRFSVVKPILGPSLLLATLGVVVSAALTALFAFYVFEMNLVQGLLLGTIVASTDAAAILFLLRGTGVELRRKVVSILEMESGSNDPVAMFLTILLVEFLLQGGDAQPWHWLALLLWQGLIGAALGLAGGMAIAIGLNRLYLPLGLQPLLASTGAIIVYAGTASLDGSGFLAVYIAGLALGNRPLRDYSTIAYFHEAASWLSQLAMFLVLGLLATPSRAYSHIGAAIFLSIFLIFIARPVAAILCLVPFKVQWKEIIFVSWVGLRGAVSIFLAIIPILAGLPDPYIYFDLAFFVVLTSILIQGGSISWVARKLGLTLQRRGGHEHRLEMDLPDAPGLEMIGYRLADEDALFLIKHLPQEAKLVFIRRQDKIFTPEEWPDPAVGDVIYLLIRPRDAGLLDQAFVIQSDIAKAAESRPLFPFKGDLPLTRLAGFYGLSLPPASAGQTIAEAFAEAFDSFPRLGDRISLGGGWLVALGVEDNEVVKAGFLLPKEEV